MQFSALSPSLSLFLIFTVWLTTARSEQRQTQPIISQQLIHIEEQWRRRKLQILSAKFKNMPPPAPESFLTLAFLLFLSHSLPPSPFLWFFFTALISSTGCCTNDSQQGMQLSIHGYLQEVPHFRLTLLFMEFKRTPGKTTQSSSIPNYSLLSLPAPFLQLKRSSHSALYNFSPSKIWTQNNLVKSPSARFLPERTCMH